MSGPTVKRSLTLSQKTNADLLELSEALGINPHSYLIGEVAKAIQRDRLALVAAKASQDGIDQMVRMVASAVEHKD